MERKRLTKIAFIVSLIIYNFFFWREGFGINLALFAGFLILNLFVQNKEAIRSRNVQFTLLGTIITAITVVIFNSWESKFAHIFSFLLMVVFIHENRMKSVLFATLHLFSSFFRVPFQIFKANNEEIKKHPKVYRAMRLLRHSLIPVCIAVVFYFLYYFANPIFGEFANNFWTKIGDAISEFFSAISFSRIMYVILGAIILSVIYFRNEVRIFLERDLSFSEKLSRIRNSRKKQWVGVPGVTYVPAERYKPPFKSIALKNQNRRGVILLGLVNVLLLFENIIDIKWLWLGFTVPEDFSLTHFVREGTGFLILSIILSMVLLLYYFRRNQNFYKNNRLLKALAYIWILQNALLCFSVFLRNYHYIDFHGLAYKRIGVYAFLSLTVFGLLTLFYKIKELRSSYYLVRINTWAVYVMLVALSLFNWDVNIAKYNLAHWNKGEIDVDFYLVLSGKALPVIYENLDMVKEQIERHKGNKVKWIRNLDYDKFVERLDKKKDRYIENQKEHTWLSFNMADKNAVQSLNQKNLVLVY